MSREPVVSTHHDAEGALSDDELDGVVGGNGTPCSVHSGQYFPHDYLDSRGRTLTCFGPTSRTTSDTLG
jgi:hypothetical protein